MKLFGQHNLVPNPSFEIHDTCPDNLGQIRRSTGWEGMQITPDFHHVCGSQFVTSIPRNYQGYQPSTAIGDSAYVGIYTSVFSDTIHEIIGTVLNDTLVVGQSYYVSFLISAAYAYLNPCFSDKLGVKFVTSIPTSQTSNSYLIDNFAHIYEDSIITDTTNWNLFYGSLVADSAYTAILIGNFFTLNNIDFYCSDVGALRAYLYIDNVCVSSDSIYCYDFNQSTSDETDIPRFTFSLLNHSLFLDINLQIKCEDLYIYDLAGKLIMRKQMRFGLNEIDLSSLAKGMYLLNFENQTYKFIY